VNALYDTLGQGYANRRKPDPRIAAAIEAALGGALSVINIGAGTGSYESAHRRTMAVEPSAIMIAQRKVDAAEVVQASAESLPFVDKSFDAATAFLTTHHWRDLAAGLREMKRVTRGPCVFLDHAPNDTGFWLIEDYFPELRPIFKPLLPLDTAREVLGRLRVVPVPVPHDCTDGFFAAYWRRPDSYLDPSVRRAISIFAGVAGDDPRLARLKRDLEDGTWMRHHGNLMQETAMDYGYRLVVANEEAAP
jgi:SAM-dependent methyltransferase